MSHHIKNKRMVHALSKLKEIGIKLNDQEWGKEFVKEDVLDKYIDNLRNQIKAEKEKGLGQIKTSGKKKNKGTVDVQTVTATVRTGAPAENTLEALGIGQIAGVEQNFG